MVAFLGPDEVLVDVKVVLEASRQVLGPDMATEVVPQPVRSLDCSIHVGFHHVQVQVDPAFVQKFHPAHLEGASRIVEGPIVQMKPSRKQLDGEVRVMFSRKNETAQLREECCAAGVALEHHTTAQMPT